MSLLRFLREGRAPSIAEETFRAPVQAHHKTGWPSVSLAAIANGRGFTQLMFCCGSRAKQMAWDKQGVLACWWGWGVEGWALSGPSLLLDAGDLQSRAHESVFGPKGRAPRWGHAGQRQSSSHLAGMGGPAVSQSLCPLGRARAASAVRRMETPQPARHLPRTRPSGGLPSQGRIPGGSA